jgi:hypothetical protein
MAGHVRKPIDPNPLAKPNVEPIDVPWQATVPYPLAETPLPLEKPAQDAAVDPALLSPVLGHYADGPTASFEKPTESGALPNAGLGESDQKTLALPHHLRGTREQRISAQGYVLDAANWVTPWLPQHLQTPYLEGNLQYLQHFSSTVKTDANIHGIPNQLIDNARPIIEKLEARKPSTDEPAAGTNPEGAHVGTGADWNTRLGVPQYRTQSDNLTSPEATCNITSLAMSLERLGYGREQALSAIDTQLREQYLEQQRAELRRKKGDPSTLPEDASQVELPEGYFEGEVKSYLKAQNAAAGKPYQGLRGKKTDEKFWDAAASRYKDEAQFEDTLDFLRHLTKAGARTDLDGITPTLLEKLEPDAEKRPTYRTITPGRDLDWQAARGQAQTVLDDGGAAMVSFYHKGGDNKADSHIISLQQLTQDGFIADDPYGGARSDYEVGETGDAYGWDGRSGRDPTKKNQVDATRTTTASQLDSDWTADAGQNLKRNERFGNSVSYTDDTFTDAWKSIRFLERAKPKQEAQ